MDLHKIINKKEIFLAIDQNRPLDLEFKYATPAILMLLNSIIAKTLSKFDHIFLLNSMITILREVVVNAIKANAKRIYFRKNGLNINDPHTYAQGMLKFKTDVIGEFDMIEDEMESSDYFVRIIFNYDDSGIKIKIFNNSPILPEELKRINHRIEKAIQYTDFADAYAEVDDETEGAGLGIVLTILFLKNMGIDPRSYKIETVNGLTETSLEVPKNLRHPEIVSSIKQRIIDEIEGIPTFPENIIQLQMLCNNPESSIDVISKKISADPALATDVLKLSNSAGFFPGKKIEDISTAVKSIGLKNLNALLTANNARKILDKRYKEYEHIWDHCNKTAVYARTIAQTFKIQGIAESSFLAGLLHDLGKIVLLSTELRTVETISEIVKDRKIKTSTVMEEISIGISHSTIGELIAKKWNFPDYLVDAIKNHHSPQNSPDQFKNLSYTVYLANLICGIEEKKYTFFYIEEAVLEKFNINDEKKFKELNETLKNAYELSKQSKI